MSGPLSRMCGSARAGVVASLLLVTPGPAAAHPHVFVDYAVAVLPAGDTVEGIRLTWTFDDLFSGFILQEFDTDRNQTLSPQEAAGSRRSTSRSSSVPATTRRST